MKPLPRPTEVALQRGYHSPQLEVDVRLNTNEAAEAPPPAFLEELAQVVRQLHPHRYPDRRATRLREAIGRHHGVGADQVFCANGSNEVLQCIHLAYGGPGRHVLVFEPTYALHGHIARLTGSSLVEGRRDASFAVDLEEAADLLRVTASSLGPAEPAITMLCSPNNPTGMADPPGTISTLAGLVPGMLVVDEAYGQFAPSSALELIGQNPNIVVVRTFSKTWAMAGLRLGYLVAAAEVVQACEQVVLPYHLDAVKQAAGVIAFGYEAEMRARVDVVVSERTRVQAALSASGLEVWPSQANFVLFRLPGATSDEIWQGLVDKSVLVRDVSGWPGLAGFLRVTIGTQEENTTFLRALGEVIAGRTA